MTIVQPQADQFDYTPETRLIDLCRELQRNHPELRSVSFRVRREDGDFTNYSWHRADDGETT